MRRRTAVTLATIAFVVGCGPNPSRSTDYRAWTENYALTVTSDPLPPHARERVLYKVVIKDKQTGQPISDGEGQIYAQSRDGVRTWDALTPGPEVGTYYGNLRFITAGEWAIGIRFRRDSTASLEKIDYMQTVANERGGAP